MIEPSSPPLQLREQLVLSPDLRVAAIGAWLPRYLGTDRASCVGRHIAELLMQLEAATLTRGISEAFSDALVRMQHTGASQATAVFTVRLLGQPDDVLTHCSLRLVLSPLSNASGQLHCIVLGIEDWSQHVSAARQLRDQACRHEEALSAVREESEAQASARTADLEHANAELLREIAQHMKTENVLRNTQEQLHQIQRLEAVGRLAGGIAHDFNNLLSIVLGYSAAIMGQLTDEPAHVALRADVDEIRRAGERAADLTRQLLAFGRQQVLEPRVLDLNEVMLRMDRMMRRILGEDIAIVTLPGERLWQAKLDPGQLEQVIVNLVINARDAMPQGGTLTIETGNQHFDEEYASAHAGAVPGPHVVLAVSDTGVGIAKETQARVFEPFFTTKAVGKGTGLGLATVFGIVKQSGGHIWLYSELGKGTTFKLCFPRCLDRVESAPPSMIVDEPVPRGSETILLVEDDAQLRTLAKTILLRQGYSVLDAPDAIEALKLSAEFPGQIPLLLTDVVMPHMGGRDLARKLVETRPLIKVLYMSGYTDNAIVHNGILDAGVAFLQKPITPDALARKVRHVLDAALSND